jgi:hypothetical protein
MREDLSDLIQGAFEPSKSAMVLRFMAYGTLREVSMLMSLTDALDSTFLVSACDREQVDYERCQRGCGRKKACRSDVEDPSKFWLFLMGLSI